MAAAAAIHGARKGLGKDDLHAHDDILERKKQKLKKRVNFDRYPAKMAKYCGGGDMANMMVVTKDAEKKSKWVVCPEGSKRLMRWDAVIFWCLIFTSFVTPYEVAFIEVSEFGLLFFVNRIIDCCFMADMILQFFLMYQEDKIGGKWISDQQKIVSRYVRGWFAIDFFSLLPFDLLAAVMKSGVMQKLKVVRIIRLLRLLKLLRVVRASRIIKRWQAEIAISYRQLLVVSIASIISVAGHWIAAACVDMIQFIPVARSLVKKHSRRI